jgi:hypothetical protein
LIDGRGGERRIGDAETEHGGVSLPEGQPGDEADFRDFDGGQPPARIDAVANRATGEYARADIVADRIAGEGRERGRPIRHVGPPDRAEREKIIERQGQISAGHGQSREHDVAQIDGHQGFEDLTGVDRTQDAVEYHRRHRDDGEAERDPDAVPADPLVAEQRRPMQRLEHAMLTIRWS